MRLKSINDVRPGQVLSVGLPPFRILCQVTDVLLTAPDGIKIQILVSASVDPAVVKEFTGPGKGDLHTYWLTPEDIAEGVYLHGPHTNT